MKSAPTTSPATRRPRSRRSTQPLALEGRLADLGATAPGGLRASVLARVGLADTWAELPSPLGTVGIAWNGRGVSWIGRVDDQEAFEEHFRSTIGRPLSRVAEVPEPLARAVARRLGGDRRARVSLDLRGHTPFEVAVWTKALEIPRGEVRPYGWVAAEIGRPRAMRAVGTALSRNPVPLVVPCHRVVRSDGSIGQYSLGGPEAKHAVLASEGLDMAQLEADTRAGQRYLGSATTRVVCLPSCHHAQRITARHRRPFATLGAAISAGFRACRDCRPGSGVILAA
ncbi:MAG: methylated-DNA--[protein]-cysteine S-methyltransferase [Chloroflexota bacterium]